jgi:serine/threonine-protein kinase
VTDVAARVAEARKLEGALLGGRYRVLRVLGAGGAAQVLRATDERTGNDVAIKILDAALAESPEVVARFAREARAASSLDSAHVVRVLESGKGEGGRPFLVMELVRGEDLGARLARLSKLPVEETVEIVLQVLDGLVDSHGAGVVHRDLKPDNVLVEERAPGQFRVKITDFGMAKVAPQAASSGLALTREGLVVGTPLYMAPEQVRAQSDVDGRADVWSVGAILFECITGRPPFLAPTQEQVMIDVCTKDAPDVRAVEPRVPRELAKVIGRALARDREQRFPSAIALRDALMVAWPSGARERTSFGGRASRPSGGERPAPPAWHQRPAVLAALAVGGLAAGLGFVLALVAALR